MTLYHYCDTRTFSEIIRNKSVWLSSLKLSNDSEEGRVVRNALLDMVSSDGISQIIKDRLDNSIQFFLDRMDGLGFCLSEEGDLLSQWRGYAEDGKGLSIGFNKEYLNALSERPADANAEMAFSLKKVIYDPKLHIQKITPIYRYLKKSIDEGALSDAPRPSLLSPMNEDLALRQKAHKEKQSEIGFPLLVLSMDMYDLKNPAFIEEKEWRMISVLFKFGDSIECSFRPSGNKIIPYKEVKFTDLGMPIIDEVILGPKHMTPPDVISMLLNSHGFKDVKVRKSSATYR